MTMAVSGVRINSPSLFALDIVSAQQTAGNDESQLSETSSLSIG